jgi:YD repeat-containing protein
MLAAPAFGSRTKDFTFHHTGSPTTPEAAGGRAPGTYETFPFTVAPGDRDGKVAVEIHWPSPTDDFDLNLYIKQPDGSLKNVKNSAQGNTNEEHLDYSGPGGAVPPGHYVIYVDNYAAVNPQFDGSARFTPTVAVNRPPIASLRAPRTAVAGRAVLLDARRSRDPDGRIASYAYDLDGNGSLETRAGRRSTLRHKFTAGRHYITLQVVDARGARAYANATIDVRRARR